MKYLFLFILFCLVSMQSTAQLEWAGLISSNNRSLTNAVAVDNNDDIITVGEFRGTTDFDFSATSNNITAQGGKDMFISKHDEIGNLLWVISMGGPNSEEIYDVAIDNSNNIYVTGRFQSPTIDMDPGAGTSNITSSSQSNYYDIFVAKYDASGSHLWSFSFGSNNLAESGYSIDVDNNGYLYVTGVFRGTIDVDPGPGTANLTPNGNADAFIAKYTDNGDYVWAFNLGSSANNTTDGKAIKSDKNGNIYVGGRFEGNIDFDPGTGTNIISGSTFLPDGYVAKYTENMDFLWVAHYSNGNQNRVSSLDVDYASGDVIVGGYFQGNIDFNPNGTAYNVNTSSSNGFLARYYANSGQLDWLKHLEGGGADPTSISIAQNGTIWTSGFYSSSVDFNYPNNQTLTANGMANIFVGQYNLTNGDFICVYDFGNSNYNESRGIDNFSNNNAVFNGNFEGSIDYDPGTGINTLTSAGGYNTAIVKVNTFCPIAMPLSASFSASNTQICEGDTITFTDHSTGNVTSWQWTFNGGNTTSANTQGPHEIVFNNSGNYQIELEVGDGSTTDNQTINILVNASATGTDTQTACDSFTWIDGNTYSSSNNTATDTIFGGAANGCDSIVTLDLTINNTATGIDTQVACDSFTWIDGNTYTISNNIATDTIFGGAASGCDSIVTLNLTINESDTATINEEACDSFTWNVNNQTYTSSGTFTEVLNTVNGCDSIVILNLSIKNTATGTDTQIACDSFTWIDGNTYTSDNNTATHTIIGGAANGCDSIVTLDLTIQSLPNITASSNSPICEGEDLVFNTTSVNGATYQWTGPNGFTSQDQNPTIDASATNNSGTYQIIVALGNNCADTTQINAVVYSRPSITGTVQDDQCNDNTGQIEIEAQSEHPPLSYSWSNGETEAILSNLTAGTYAVTVSDSNSCSTSETFQIYNNMDDCNCFVYVANAFSPNGDGNNDLIPVRGKCVSSLSFKIFNRWGNLVFSTDKLDDGWNGKYQGELQNTGVFVYTLEATFENGKTIVESGDINLIR